MLRTQRLGAEHRHVAASQVVERERFHSLRPTKNVVSATHYRVPVASGERTTETSTIS